MSQINQLTAVDSVVAGDQIPVWSINNGSARKAAASVLLAFIQDNITFPASFTKQFAAPSATGFSVDVGDGEVWLVLTPVAGYAAGTIVLPAGPTDGDEFLCNCTQAVTTLTIDGNGKTVTGGPTTLAANAYFRLKYEAITGTWYRVG